MVYGSVHICNLCAKKSRKKVFIQCNSSYQNAVFSPLSNGNGEKTSLNKLTAYSSKELLATNWMSALKVDQRNNLGFMRLNCNQVVDL